jgi:hypothetical protein
VAAHPAYLDVKRKDEHTSLDIKKPSTSPFDVPALKDWVTQQVIDLHVSSPSPCRDASFWKSAGEILVVERRTTTHFPSDSATAPRAIQAGKRMNVHAAQRDV